LGGAIADLRRTVSQKPNYAEAHNALGLLLREKAQDMEEVNHEFREAIRHKPDYAEAHYNLGSLLAENKKTGEAIAEFREAIRLRPDFADAHNSLGLALADTELDTQRDSFLIDTKVPKKLDLLV
jgi:protein O-GlcNAc transferase